MSGMKYSVFDVIAAVAQMLLDLQRVRTLRARLNALREKLARLLDNTAEGVRQTFELNVRAATQWLKETESVAKAECGLDTPPETLQELITHLESALVFGEQLLGQLTEAFTTGANQLAKNLGRVLDATELQFNAGCELLARWHGPDEADRFRQRLSRARAALAQQQYTGLERELNALLTELTTKLEHANAMEAKHQKRLYLLKALRQVCTDMGFQEEGEPHFERSEDYTSRIVYEVDTLDRGRIRFLLGLEGVTANSEIADNQCFGEFDQISKFLHEQYGIQTAFKRADGNAPPKLIQKGELEEPGGAGLEAAAG